jgi:hypothetical protein
MTIVHPLEVNRTAPKHIAANVAGISATSWSRRGCSQMAPRAPTVMAATTAMIHPDGELP